jgi:hypothetical protein
VTIVVANMVKRALINPDEGVTQESQSVGPYSHSQSYANPLRNLFLTDSDRLLIAGPTATASSAYFGNDTEPLRRIRVPVVLPVGAETVTFFTEVDGDDGYGTPTRVPGATPTVVYGCWVYPVSSSEAQALGEQLNTVYAVAADVLPGGAWSLIVWDGRNWEPLGEPLRYRSGFTGMELATVYMKSRGPEAVS